MTLVGEVVVGNHAVRLSEYSRMIQKYSDINRPRNSTFASQISVGRATETSTQTGVWEGGWAGQPASLAVASTASWPVPTVILRGCAWGATGIRRVNTPSV